MRHLDARGHHLARIDHRPAAKGYDTISPAIQCQLLAGLYYCYRWLGVDIGKYAAGDACVLQRFDNGLLIIQRMKSAVGNYQDALITAGTTNFAGMLAGTLTFRNIWLGQRNGMNNLTWQTVNLFSEVI